MTRQIKRTARRHRALTLLLLGALLVSAGLGVGKLVGIARAKSDPPATTTTAFTPPAVTPPAPSITSKPDSLTASSSAAFGFGDSQSGVTFLCKLDSGSFTACSSPKSSSGLAQGSHTFQVEAVSGSKTSAASSYSWVVDTPPDVTSIAHVGSTPTNTTGSVSWKVTLTKSVTGVGTSDFALVKAGGLAGSSAISGVTGSGAVYTVTASSGSGSGTLGLNLVDDDSIKDAAGMPLGGPGAGNGNATGDVFTFLRTPPPAPSITSGPNASPAWTTTTGAALGFGDTQSGVSFLCKLDAASFGACSSPKSYGGLGQGTHTFQVEAQDSFGNTSTATSRTWQIDSVSPPAPHISSGPADPTNHATGAFTFTETETGASLWCSLDGSTYASCSSPKSYSGLGEGEHTFRAVARDAAGNQSGPDSRSWFVDLTPPPVPTIVYGPTQAPAVTSATGALFAFGGIDTGHDPLQDSYACSLDGGSFAPCFLLQGYSNLSQGQHRFRVEATDDAGNVSAPVTWMWIIDTVSPTVAFTQTPPNPDVSTSPTFRFSGTDTGGSGVGGYRCKLDASAWAGCTSPDSLSNLSAVSHTFQVESIDLGGNLSSPASYTWTISSAQGLPFTITGNATGTLYPGAAPSTISLKIANPNSVTIYVTSVTITVSNATCNTATNIAIHQLDLSTAAPTAGQIAVPAGGSVTLPAQGVGAPTIRMIETGVNQAPACANQTFNLTYSGSAHS